MLPAALEAKADPSAVREALEAELKALVADGSLPQALVLISQDDTPLIEIAAGYSDIATKTPIRRDALFRLYSMSKPITTLATLQLVEQGRFALDTPVGDFLPELADLKVWDGSAAYPPRTLDTTRPVTILDLLTHTSGITYEFMGASPVHRFYREHGVGRTTQATSGKAQAEPAHDLGELVARLGTAPLLHQPGEPFSYGFSTTVLGAVIEKVSGQSLDAYLKAHIFAPLQMTDTTFVVSDAQARRLVTGYRASPGGLVAVDAPATSEYRDPKRLRDGGGALAGTLEDYRHFAEMLAHKGVWQGKRVLSEASVNLIFSPRLRTGGGEHLDSPFGLGLAIGDAGTEARGGLPIGAGSWSGSANTYFFVDPLHDIVAILMTNELTPGPFEARTWRLREAINRAALAVAER
ncbi:serine hydrolase domain-containing protein [Novosphingobium mangrovi (ex Hu et al. 2023)]|uniref:Beta-lactamase family protein n=1 Tax=Novosphingobium mangrovi (ex Hu et al. 2023) TaxID=2930094 RepID=A0ABT0ABS5_9SPHN|nr:serine hydrolase domain-containing protein [Novosphingobium mangrovi (ex Hu et al. 2023)]MCJ1960653.1 beta-lactamase family protein [Novosphingobium mangrovi (ex Hu et al. 2023)]